MLKVSLVGSLCFLLSLIISYILIHWAGRWGMIDKPNERSSHSTPTPKGGGIAFFLVFTLFLVVVLAFQKINSILVSPLLFGGPVVVALGWMDDRHSLSAGVRLIVHFFVSVVILGLVTRWFSIPIQISFLPELSWLTGLFSLLFIAWFINLYNFMDGADGLAASTAIVASLLLAVITFYHGSTSLAIIYIVLAYCVGGFLFYNWHPAQLFMGDTGSYFLGFVFATLALICKMYSNISFYTHIIIFGCFIVDATYTLIVRAIRGEKIYMAHKQMGFQKAMARGWSHRKVATVYNMVTILWLFPLANLASLHDMLGMLYVCIAYLPLVIFLVYVKAGFREED